MNGIAAFLDQPATMHVQQLRNSFTRLIMAIWKEHSQRIALGLMFGSVTSGSQDLPGVIMTVDLHKQDTVIKILLGCTGEEIRTILDFHNTKSMRAFLVRRPPNKIQEREHENDSRISS